MYILHIHSVTEEKKMKDSLPIKCTHLFIDIMCTEILMNYLLPINSSPTLT